MYQIYYIYVPKIADLDEHSSTKAFQKMQV